MSFDTGIGSQKYSSSLPLKKKNIKHKNTYNSFKIYNDIFLNANKNVSFTSNERKNNDNSVNKGIEIYTGVRNKVTKNSKIEHIGKEVVNKVGRTTIKTGNVVYTTTKAVVGGGISGVGIYYGLKLLPNNNFLVMTSGIFVLLTAIYVFWKATKH